MNIIDFIKEKQLEWFNKIKPFLLQTNINVGSGLGYFSKYAKQSGFQMTSLEINIHELTINPEDVILYNGNEIPFVENFFETATAMYVLHHTANPSVLLNEMKRISSKRLIIVEEVYTSFFGKIHLALLDWYINFKAHQKSKIFWNSYFSQKKLKQALEQNDWKIIECSINKKFGFNEVLYIVDKK